MGIHPTDFRNTTTFIAEWCIILYGTLIRALDFVFAISYDLGSPR